MSERRPLNAQNDGGAITLKKRKKLGCLAKFLISLAVSVVVLVVIVVAGLLIGNHLLKSNFGVSLYDLLGCMSDLKNVKEENVVTNPYGETDADGFYVALDSSLFLNDGTIDSEYIGGIADATTSGGDVAGAITGIISRDSFSAAKLASYNTVNGTYETETFVTDRQLAAFLNDFLIESGRLDEVTGDLSSVFGSAKLGDMITLEQAIMQSGADMNETDKAVLGAEEDGVYLTVTFSLDVKTAVKSVMDNMGAGGFVWAANLLLPDSVYFSATFDLADAAYGVKFNVNDMAQQPCEMNYITDEMKAKYGDDISQYDRLCIIIEGFSGTDINLSLSESMSGLTEFLCKSDTAEEGSFSFADMIDLDSVAPSDGGGNEFRTNALGFMTDAINSATGGSATRSDIVAILQALICTDYGDAYGVSDRVDLYTEDVNALSAALTECGFTSITDIRSQSDLDKLLAVYDGIAYDEPSAPVSANAVNVYDSVFMSEFANSYGIDMNKYQGGGSSGTVIGEYTFSDLMALAESSDETSLTQEQQELLRRIGEAYVAGSAEGTAPVFGITDKMLGAVLRELSDIYATADTAISLRSVDITSSEGKKYADLVFTVDAGSIVSDSTIGALLPDYVSVGVRADITEGKGISREKATIVSFNGLTENGGVSGIEELTCQGFLDSLRSVLPSVNFDDILTSVTDGLNELADNISEYFPGAVFVTE